MLFSTFEVCIHVVIGVNSLSTFGEYGMNILYSPGLITSLFGFLPVSVGLTRRLFRKKPFPSLKQWIMAVVGMFALCFLLINLPEMVLGKEDNPYAFTDRGYYRDSPSRLRRNRD